MCMCKTQLNLKPERIENILLSSAFFVAISFPCGDDNSSNMQTRFESITPAVITHLILNNNVYI